MSLYSGRRERRKITPWGNSISCWNSCPASSTTMSTAGYQWGTRHWVLGHQQGAIPMEQTGALRQQGQAEKALNPVSVIQGPHPHTRGLNRKWEPLPPGGGRLLASNMPTAGRPYFLPSSPLTGPTRNISGLEINLNFRPLTVFLPGTTLIETLQES